LRIDIALLQGTGNVGADLARRCVDYGATVFTADVVPHRADIKGATNVSDCADFAALAVDVFSPNAAAGVITADVAARLRCAAIVGAANVPFASEEAREVAARRGIVTVPDHLASAGAIIVDSLEWLHSDYRSTRPSAAYSFIMAEIRKKVGDYLTANSAGAARAGASAAAAPAASARGAAADSSAIGSRMGPWLRDKARHRDVVVIGGGMAGTAAAYQLAKRAPALRGAVLEAGAEVAPPQGSSYGESRMFRRMYSDAYFSDLQAAALDMWRELESDGDVSLLEVNGLLFYGSPDTGETVEGSIPGCADVMRRRGVPHKYYGGAADLADAFKPMQPEAGHVGLMEEGAGSVNSSLACQTMMRVAQQGGAWELHTHARVVDVWRQDGDER
jgi:FAD dependent oxidoreductase/Glutamate/Leucine/Phenylalanine/Valine dehydrogenase